MAGRERLDYLDNLKVCLVLLVIVHHVGQAYGATGGAWFYAYPGERIQGLSNFFGFNASFFMGLFFFISGYFFPPSLDRHGPRQFLTDKLRRFGLPLLFIALGVTPVLAYAKFVHAAGGIGFGDFYLRHWLTYAPGKPLSDLAFNVGHLWFVEHLLVYAVLYAAFRAAWAARPGRPPAPPAGPAVKVPLPAILLFTAALGFVTHQVRTTLGFPIDRWVFLLGFIQVEPAHLPQYLSLFTLGVLACRHGFLASLAARRHILWLVPGLGVFAFTVAQRYLVGDGAAFYLWEYREALLCVGVCIGLLALFRTCFNGTGPLARVLADNAYGAYVIHVAVVVALQYAFDAVPAGAGTLFTAVSILAIPASFLGASLLRRIPGLKRIL